VYDAVIPRTVRLSEAPGFGLPVTHYAPRSKGAAAYRSLAREVLERPVSGEPLPTEESPRMVVSQPVPSAGEEEEEVEVLQGGSDQASTPAGEAGPHHEGGLGGESEMGEVEGGPEGPAAVVPGGGSGSPSTEPGPRSEAEAVRAPSEEAEGEGSGGPIGPGDGEAPTSSQDQEDEDSGGRWRLFRRKQGGGS
jgi:hypothetical protein